MAPEPEKMKASKTVDVEAPDINLKHKADEKPAKPFPGWRTGFFRRLFFLDVEPLVAHGYSTRLEPQDMYREETLETKRLEDRFSKALAAEQDRAKKLGLPGPDLRRVIIAGNGWMLLWTGVLYVIAQACSLAGPLLLQRIVKGLNCMAAQNMLKDQLGTHAPNIGCDEKSQLYYNCIGLFAAPAIQSMCENHYTYLLYMMGTRMRNSLMAAIYRKCLRLSNSALQAESTGKVVTLMSNDAQKLQDATMAIHALWGSPCYIIAVLILLWFQVGWAMFVGLGVMLLLLPMTGMLAAKMGSLRREIIQWTDKRVGYMNEIIQGIQMIKFYAWEVPFAAKVQSARSQEARILRKNAFWTGIFGMVLFAGPVAVAIFCFGSYTIAGHTLSNASAYTALSLFSLMRFPMSFLPMLITMYVNAMVALKRIGAFLVKAEAGLPSEEEGNKTEQGVVKVQDGEFTWDEAAEKSTLTGINIEAKPGSLTMIVGGVGSGKSSLLSSLIGHISKRGGTVSVGGTVAYVAQTAWIMNDSVQENVLIGHDMNPQAYKQAIAVSQLGPDLDILPNGDLTEIGDRGVTLSGGQKQRVSIARAVYCDADIYLLDDPLSAVDSHVGRALFEQCIRGPLRGKTVLLVTNALQYLPHADNVIIMEEGQIKVQGSYAALVEQGLDIEELAHLHDKEGHSDGDAEEEEDQVTHGTRPEAQGADGKGDGRSSAAGKKKDDKGHRASLDKKAGEGKVTLSRPDTQNGANRNLTGVEEREAGNISMDVVMRYFRAGGGPFAFLTLLFLYAGEQASRVYTDKWVGIWFGGKYNLTLGGNLGIYFMLGCIYSIFTFIRSLRFLYVCVSAAVSLHNQLLAHLLRLPKTFFDTNPAGRILNRFSRDTDIMDITLSYSLIQFVGCVTTYISILIVISIATKWFAIGLAPLTIVYLFIQRYYVPAARELQRIESVSRSPIYSKFGEAMLGVATIRAYRREEHFTQVSDQLMETNANAFVTQKLAAAWLAMRLDMLGLAVLTACGVLVIAVDVEPGMAGLAIMYALDLTRFLKQGTNMASKSEADFNSVERIVQYLKPETEPEPETQEPLAAELEKAQWPAAGAISVQKVSMRYRPNMPLVLKGVSFEVAGGEKVGLVGRTGSGKSSMLLVLFRMVEAEAGRIMIDGVDIGSLGVRHLRSKMSIIPQDPFMFSGTVRNNLDPFEQHTDDALWEALERVGLKPVVSELDQGLGSKVVDNGANFSLGQRQLICMARAMLRNSRILMLDEATASVDMDTDNLLQMAIRTVFADCTTLIIAHRLNTIMDVDRVIVMGNGNVLENDHPDELLKHHKGSFSAMVDQTGKSSARYLRGLASSARKGESFRTKSVMRSGLSFAARGPSVSVAAGSSTVSGVAPNGSFSKQFVLPGSGSGPATPRTPQTGDDVPGVEIGGKVVEVIETLREEGEEGIAVVSGGSSDSIPGAPDLVVGVMPAAAGAGGGAQARAPAMPPAPEGDGDGEDAGEEQGGKGGSGGDAAPQAITVSFVDSDGGSSDAGPSRGNSNVPEAAPPAPAPGSGPK